MHKRRIKLNAVTIGALVILAVVLLMVVVPSLFTRYDPLAVDMTQKLAPPSAISSTSCSRASISVARPTVI